MIRGIGGTCQIIDPIDIPACRVVKETACSVGVCSFISDFAALITKLSLVSWNRDGFFAIDFLEYFTNHE